MKAIIFDTETTGLIESRKKPLSCQPEIIEFYGAYVDLETGDIINELELLIKPKHVKANKLDPIIEKITGLNYLKDLSTKETYAFYSEEIQNFFNQSDCAIAHNMSYDKDMIEIENERLQNDFKFPDRMICTIEQTMHLKGYRLNLNKLHEGLFDKGFTNAHRAKNDVNALIKCSVELRNKGII